MNSKTVTRFAPSPTGFIHVGAVRTALFAFLQARHEGGTFILRIEDTDKKREVAGSITHIIESLRWLGINWDEGPEKDGPHAPYLQSQRLESYKRYAQKLVEKGCAYPDPYTEEEVDDFRKRAGEEKRPFFYRDHRPTNLVTWDELSPLRFKNSDLKRTKWHDAVRGDLEAGEEALDDFIIMKGDGYPTYNFAHIVDDIEMGVTHVMRGQEFISSTPNYLALYRALEIEPPIFATLPPILGKERTKKLSKRDGAKDILDYRADGYLPEAMVNYLATLGWAPQGAGMQGGEDLFLMEHLVGCFDISKVQRAGAAWDEDKLLWMNKAFMKRGYVSDDRLFLDAKHRFDAAGQVIEHTVLRRALPTLLEHISIWNDLKVLIEHGEVEYLITRPRPSRELFGTLAHLPKVIELLAPVMEWTTESIKSAVWDYASNVGRGEVLAPMRIALSGMKQSPDPFTLAYIVGKEEALARLQYATTL